MGSLPVIGWQPKDNTGAIMSGALAYFYQTGASTTPKNTYSDKALTSANANPVEADAYGRFGDIFLMKDEGYRVVLKTSAGVTIYTKDDVFAESFAYDEETQRKSIVASPRDYGAVGDGTTDDAVALAAAFAAATVVDLEGLTYKCTASLATRSGMTIRNGTLDFSASMIPYGVGATGTIGAASIISSATTGGQSITPASVAGLSAGDMVLLYSEDTIGGPHRFAEIFRIEQISGSDVLIDGLILGTYATSPNLRKITPVSDVLLEKLTIKSPSTGAPIDLSYADRIRVRDVTIKGSSSAEYARVINSCDVVIDGCAFLPSSTSEAGGLVICDASRDVTVSECRFERILTPIELGEFNGDYDGVTRNIKILDCDVIWCGQIDIHEGAWYVDIRGNTIECDASPSAASTPAIKIAGADVTVSNNTIRNPEGNAIQIAPVVSCDYIRIVDNAVIGGETHAVLLSDTALTIQSVEICRNRIRECAGDYIRCLGTTVSSLVIEGNDLAAATVGTKAINLTMADAAASVSVSRNKIRFGATSFTYGVYYTIGSGTTGRAVINGNDIDGTSAAATVTGVYVANGAGNLAYADISSNTIVAFVTGINQAASTAVSKISLNVLVARTNVTGTGIAGVYGGDISHNTISRVSGTTGVFTGISANGANGMSVCGNNVLASQSGIVITGDGTNQGIVVAGNSVVVTPEGGANWYGISLVGTTLTRVAVTGNTVIFTTGGTTCLNIGTVDGITIAGNAFTGGTNGISFGTVTEAVQSDNIFSGNTATTGTYTNSSVNTGFINLDITTVKIIAANDLQATTEGMLPDTNTAPLLQRINAATDKGHRLVWAAASVVEVDFAPFAYPPDLDDAAAVTVCLLISKSGNTDTSAVVGVSYFEGIGDSDAGGNTAALATAAITKYTVTISASNVGAYPTMAKIGLTPGAHANDAIRLHAAWIEYTSKNHTA